MSCNNFTKPILGTSEKVTVPTITPKSLSELGVSLDSDVRNVIIDFDGDPQDPTVIGRFWEDETLPSSAEGKAIIGSDSREFTLQQANGLRLIAIGSAFDMHLTQYEREDVT